MGRVGLIDDALRGIWNYFRGKPDLVVPRRIPPTTRPRPDPDPEPLPPVPHRPPYVPRLRDDEPETEPEGHTEGETTTTTEDMQECETCPDCEPRKQGHAVWRTLTGTDAAKLSGAQYQNWVIPWFRWVGNQIEEWEFSGKDFDGIDPVACELIETKGKYGFMFAQPNGLEPVVQPWGEATANELKHTIFDQQYTIVSRYQPHVRLRWVVNTWSLWIYMGDYISEGKRIYARAEHAVYPGWDQDD